jgi:hypothetical protein
MSISLRDTIKLKNFTTFAIFFHTEQNFTMRVSSLPAGPLREKISWAVEVYVLRALQKNPAWLLPFPKI